MPSFFQTHTFESLQERFEAALAWISTHHAELDRNRLGRYRALLARLVNAQSADDIDTLKREADNFLEVLYEVEEILEIHRGFRDRKVRGLESRLKLLADGPLKRKDERPNRASIIGRNTALELILASRLQMAGLRVDLSHDEDVRANHRWRRIYCECKRPSSQKQILPKLKEAIKQCNTRIAKCPLKLGSGIVLVDISWVANPKSDLIRRRSAQEINTTLSGAIENFLREFVPKLNLDREPRLLGVMARFSGLAVNNETNQLNHAQQWGYAVNSELQGFRSPMAKAVAAAMAEAIAREATGVQQEIQADGT